MYAGVSVFTKEKEEEEEGGCHAQLQTVHSRPPYQEFRLNSQTQLSLRPAPYTFMHAQAGLDPSHPFPMPPMHFVLFTGLFGFFLSFSFCFLNLGWV